jgi:hypothetical protein
MRDYLLDLDVAGVANLADADQAFELLLHKPLSVAAAAAAPGHDPWQVRGSRSWAPIAVAQRSERNAVGCNMRTYV